MYEWLYKIPFWNNLNEFEKKKLESTTVIKKYHKGFILHGNCDYDQGSFGMIYIISGEIRAYLVSDEGREVTLFRIKAGEYWVLSDCCLISQVTFDTQFEVSKDAEILVIPTTVFSKLSKDNIYVRCFSYEVTVERASGLLWVMEQIVFAKFDERLATFLLNEYSKTGSKCIYMTQEQVAQDVNSAREVVTRMLKRFASEGLIENQRGVIVIKDINGLKKLLRAS